MSEIQTRSAKQSFVSSRDGLGKFLKTIAVICAISLALVAGSFYARAIQDHIDAQEKPSGAINSGLMASKETARRQLSRYLIHKQYKIDKPGQSVSAVDLGQRLGPSIFSNAISTKLEMIEKMSFQT